MFRDNEPLMKMQLLSEPSDMFIFNKSNFFLGHEAFIRFRETAIEIELGDEFKDGITKKFEAFIGFGFERKTKRRDRRKKRSRKKRIKGRTEMSRGVRRVNESALKEA